MKRRGLFISNLPYVLWLAFYFGVFSYLLYYITDEWWQALLIAVITYAVSIPMALSPLGEDIFRMAEGIRPLATNKEKSYLLPLFDEVYTKAKIKTPNINPNIQLYTSDNLFPNACALGNGTIAVTKGLVESMTPEQIKAFIGHEFGHIVHGDTKAMILRFIGNGIFSICALAAQLYVRALMFLARLFQIGIFMTLIMSLAYLVLIPIAIAVNVAIFLLKEIGEIILMSVSRTNEYYADEYSYDLGYGDELISGLYEFQDMYTSRKISILQQLKSTHPYLANRIQRLEAMNATATVNMGTPTTRTTTPILTAHTATPTVAKPATVTHNPKPISPTGRATKTAKKKTSFSPIAAIVSQSATTVNIQNNMSSIKKLTPQNPTFQQIIGNIYTSYGVSVFETPKKLKHLLSDLARKYKKESTILYTIIENTDIVSLISNSNNTDFPFVTAKLVHDIEQSCGYSEDIAKNIVNMLSLLIQGREAFPINVIRSDENDYICYSVEGISINQETRLSDIIKTDITLVFNKRKKAEAQQLITGIKNLVSYRESDTGNNILLSSRDDIFTVGEWVYFIIRDDTRKSSENDKLCRASTEVYKSQFPDLPNYKGIIYLERC